VRELVINCSPAKGEPDAEERDLPPEQQEAARQREEAARAEAATIRQRELALARLRSLAGGRPPDHPLTARDLRDLMLVLRLLEE
jgi:hypothetical protein